MVNAPGNLIWETTSSTGTGNLTVAVVTGNRTFNDEFGTGGTDLFDYFITHRTAAEWERGTGHLLDATTLVRDTVIESSNANAAVNFSAGTKDVTNDVPAAKQVVTDLAQTLTNKTIATADNTLTPASTTVAGINELATSAEINTGTDATRGITPDALAGSNLGIRYFQPIVFDFTADVATGDGKFYFHIPAALDGKNLVEVHAEVVTAGTTGTMTIQVHNVDNALDMLSTLLSIDSGETGSDTAATPAVINTSNDHVNTNDVIRIDVDAIQTTPAQGLIVTLGFQLP